MGRTNTTGSLRKSLAKDIEYLRDHIEIAREMLSAMLADNSEDATRRYSISFARLFLRLPVVLVLSMSTVLPF